MSPTPPPPDRRVLKTRTALREAMLSLMATRGWDDIAIQDICRVADVGRSTFYLHYQGKGDLLSEGFDDLRAHLAVPDRVGGGPGLWFLSGLLQHMDEQRAVFRTVLGRRSGQGVLRGFKETVHRLVVDELAQRQHPAADAPWVTRFMAGGIVDAMAWWVDAPDAMPLPQLARELHGMGEIMLSRSVAPNPAATASGGLRSRTPAPAP